MTGSIDMPCVISINELQLVITNHASMLFIIKSNQSVKRFSSFKYCQCISEAFITEFSEREKHLNAH